MSVIIEEADDLEEELPISPLEEEDEHDSENEPVAEETRPLNSDEEYDTDIEIEGECHIIERKKQK